MNLIIEKPGSKKVKEVQSRFDVEDFKKAENLRIILMKIIPSLLS